MVGAAPALGHRKDVLMEKSSTDVGPQPVLLLVHGGWLVPGRGKWCGNISLSAVGRRRPLICPVWPTGEVRGNLIVEAACTGSGTSCG